MLDILERPHTGLSDRYVIDGELGHGGMAHVVLAEDRRHHRRVAIKVMRPDVAAALGPERFLREIEISARLTHPHTLPLHNSGRARRASVLRHAFVEDESLRDRLQREKMLPVDDAVRIAREVAEALSSRVY